MMLTAAKFQKGGHSSAMNHTPLLLAYEYMATRALGPTERGIFCAATGPFETDICEPKATFPPKMNESKARWLLMISTSSVTSTPVRSPDPNDAVLTAVGADHAVGFSKKETKEKKRKEKKERSLEKVFVCNNNSSKFTSTRESDHDEA